jgi:hypothetical protein
MGRSMDKLTVRSNEPTPPGAARPSIAERSGLRVVQGKVVDKHLERITFILDEAIRIPGTNIRFGLDPIIGFFFPVAGDILSTLISAYVVLASIRHGLPKGVITRMVFNVALDYGMGSIPFVGDLFDFAWRSNEKNINLLNKHASSKRGSFWSDWAWAFLLLGALGFFIVGLLTVIFFALRAIGFRWI